MVKSEAQVPRVSSQADVTQPTESSSSPGAEPTLSPVRAYLLNCGSSSLADRVFSILMLLCALSIFGIVLLILVELISGSKLTIQKFGISFSLGPMRTQRKRKYRTFES